MLTEDGQVKIKTKFVANLKEKEVYDKVKNASDASLLEVVVLMTNDIMQSPPVGSPVLTGHNRRSICYKVGTGGLKRMGRIKSGEEPFNSGVPNVGPEQGAIWSSSGYGGWLEVGTTRMAPRPYFRPAYDRHYYKLPSKIKAHV